MSVMFNTITHNLNCKNNNRRSQPTDIRPPTRRVSAPDQGQPRPMNGIFVAMTVMNWTLASSGSVAM
jgi:hypothetical protein